MEFKKLNLSEHNLNNYSNFLNIVFKSRIFNLKYLNWLYKQNPYGEAVGFDVFENNDIIGHYATIPVMYSCNNQLTKGLLSLNTATHPDFQGRGIFTNLALKTYDLAKELGYEFVIGVANKDSTPGFIKKLDFEIVTKLEVYFSITYSIKKPRNEFNFHSMITNDYFQWRLSNPNNKYTFKQNNIFTSTKMPLTQAVISTDSEQRVKLSKTTNKPFIIASLGVNNKPSTFLKFKLPEKLKPAPLNLILLPLTRDFILPHSKEIFFENFDFDVY